MLSITLKPLISCDGVSLTSFLMEDERSLIYYSINYLKFIEHLTNSKCFIFIATEENEIKGIFPFFRKDTPIGTVINSSPFYGSHGGCLAMNESIERQLIQNFTDYCKQGDILTATIIPPFYKDSDLHKTNFKPDFTSFRFSQCKILPLTPYLSNNDELENALFQSIPSKTRNMIRKPIKAGVSVVIDNSIKGIEFLRLTHEKNCSAIGIVAKKPLFFQTFNKYLIENQDFKIFVAYLEDQPIAALLCLYHNKTVEYFVPVILESHRTIQPLSLIIFEAMKQAIAEGYKYWNWGGTSMSAENVFRFKDSWGTENGEYNYYTKILSEDVYMLSRADIEQYMEYFFLVNYDKLEN